MGFMPSRAIILVIRAHSYQLGHDEITRQYGREGFLQHLDHVTVTKGFKTPISFQQLTFIFIKVDLVQQTVWAVIKSLVITYRKFTAESASERIVKIGQYLILSL